MLMGFKCEVKKGQAMDVVAVTYDPFKWFPELKQAFKNFNINEITIELDPCDSPVGVVKTIFKIKKVK